MTFTPPIRSLALLTAGLVLTACGQDNPLAPQRMADLRFPTIPSFSTAAASFGALDSPITWSISVDELLPGDAAFLAEAGGGGINEDGWVAGAVDAQFNGTWWRSTHATVWTADGTAIDLGVLPPGHSSQRSWAVDINDAGMVVGYGHAPTASGTCCIGIRGFAWTAAGGMQVLPPLGGSTTATSYARAINNAGHIAGSAQTLAGETHAVVWMAPDQAPVDLGGFGGTFSAASDLNDLGQVTGSYASGGNRSAFLWSETGAVTLGQLNGGDTEARGINNRGHVVGFATFEDFTQRAFRWTPEHGMEDLGLPEGTIRSRATAINDAGHIAVEAEIDDGSGNVLERAFLWIDGTWLDLGDLGRSGPQGINEKLQLSGFGIGPTAGMPRAIRWNVTAPQVTPRYPFEGFFAPIDNLPQVNRVRAGSAIPFKFSLGGDQGLDILAEGFPLSQPIACDAGAELDPIEEIVKAGGSSLTYDPVTEQYNYIWKTDRSWAGTCRRLTVRLKDGQEHSADFSFPY